jgi:cellobiose phosphorylase
MEQVTLKHGWDGEWFLRAYDDFGAKIGSKECKEGKIFIESNGFCTLAGIGLDDGKAAQALAAVNKHLATKHGIVVQQPAYTKYYIEPGRNLLLSAGIQGERRRLLPRQSLGHDRRNAAGPRRPGHDYYSRINPSAREEISDLHRCEPYVYAQMIAGKDAPSFGEAKNSWLTGTAAWNYYAIVQWILGIRTSLDGLEIAPVIPKAGRASPPPALPRSGLQDLHRAQGRWKPDRSHRGRRAHRGQHRTSSHRRPEGSYGQGHSELTL